ncbi:Rad4-domain-containing protein [Lindgomyces ingoldianus]|uniref:Rad4-domain-containing protein n=1 Tax=Lindgomyces ingoldianus TaxID=673940 RepID=A0ACB6QQD0_9PLEO|nr:Rad4-domain-containing protein [Lindgomyces ingoldianus]KAF2468492.1 Rad4-domain-containing protein [Lindgomyces ingoldianus]
MANSWCECNRAFHLCPQAVDISFIPTAVRQPTHLWKIMAGPRSSIRKPASAPTGGRTTRRSKASQEDAEVPEVFQGMLSEATASKAAGSDEDSKPLKKRKTARSMRNNESNPSLEALTAPLSLNPETESQRPLSKAAAPDDDADDETHHMLQTITESEESDGSDMEWEDALAPGDEEEGLDVDGDALPEVGDISITIGGDKGEGKRPKRARRRGITSVDKKRRLEIHKMHILCLLYHVHRRNTWCNDGKVQAIMRRMPSPKTLSNLVLNPELSQSQASKRFLDGMHELKLLWSNRFSVTAIGMHKPRWVDADVETQSFSLFNELDDPMDRQDFRRAATTLQGSQDVGAQLFCALLRGIGVEARLVCSLQCLPFASAAQVSTPPKPSSQTKVMILNPYNKEEAPSPSKSALTANPKASTPARPKRLSRLERALGERSAAYNSGVAPKQKKKYHTAYPVYWVEAFNPVVQKWIPIDPLSTFTVDKPEKLEPPLSYSQNSLVYAIAFEDDSTAKDVTRRYAKAYNAKTRKFRVECTEGGAKWWKRALKLFRRAVLLDRDQVEDAALARKEAAEGMPKNVQDFKNHPVYVLERHVKQNEVIHPMNQVGKVNVGSSMNPKMEPIYRRRDVHIVRSADRWYRLGRDVKGGEQPLKHAKLNKGSRLSMTPGMEIDDSQEEVGAGLYAAFQTELYVPPPVVRGRVPRNGFGNLDLYVPSMVPKGGVHIRHQHASKAARIIGVDYADAVTGFSFKGRHGTAVVQGVVVAQEYAEAVETVLHGMEYAQEQSKAAQRSVEALRLWRRFCLGLRIAQRVNAIEIDGEKGNVMNVQEEIEKVDRELAAAQLAGGFFPEGGDAGEVSAPSSRLFKGSSHNDHFGGGFVPSDDDEDDGFILDGSNGDDGLGHEEQTTFGSALLAQQHIRPQKSDDFGGGFMQDDYEEDGGFVCEAFATAGPSNLRSEKLEGSFIQTDGAAEGSGRDFIRSRDQEPRKNTGEITALARDHEMAQPLHEEPTTKPSSQLNSPEETITSNQVPGGDQKEIYLSVSSPSDGGSLPLEDPEDEDADPEWLYLPVLATSRATALASIHFLLDIFLPLHNLSRPSTYNSKLGPLHEVPSPNLNYSPPFNLNFAFDPAPIPLPSTCPPSPRPLKSTGHPATIVNLYGKEIWPSFSDIKDGQVVVARVGDGINLDVPAQQGHSGGQGQRYDAIIRAPPEAPTAEEKKKQKKARDRARYRANKKAKAQASATEKETLVCKDRVAARAAVQELAQSNGPML